MMIHMLKNRIDPNTMNCLQELLEFSISHAWSLQEELLISLHPVVFLIPEMFLGGRYRMASKQAFNFFLKKYK